MLIDKISEFVLLESMVMIRAQDHTFGGRITYIDGDVFEIALNENKNISLGESVGITIYAEGLITFDTYPIGFYRKHVLCILPPPVQRRFFQRRKEVLLPVQHLTCTIERINKTDEAGSLNEETDSLCEVKNLSMSEILFAAGSVLGLQRNERISLHLGEDLQLEAVIQHIKHSGEQPLYLAELQEVTKSAKQNLKSLMISQLAIHRNEQIRSEQDTIEQDIKSNEINSYIFNNFRPNKK
ncbi:hypothetical protein ACFQ3J_07090 [Paenibacillus provencensis]|uniref:PilZ domain-containing protein n=1 Tax=Paenibacillus provencensis TaxID=441151 RepID=A0ABW3PQ83_9BACL|nr:hypothetical protein [Paenibacillus sp. MER 78]MCM3129688.1 hypothetical protein [Paenibacillus sp. MER 78]